MLPDYSPKLSPNLLPDLSLKLSTNLSPKWPFTHLLAQYFTQYHSILLYPFLLPILLPNIKANIHIDKITHFVLSELHILYPFIVIGVIILLICYEMSKCEIIPHIITLTWNDWVSKFGKFRRVLVRTCRTVYF
jgi:hypothetical protein